MTDTTGKLAAALAKVQAALPVVHKGKTADTGKYSYDYADLADVTAAIMPLLAKHGLAFACHPRLDNQGRGYELAATLLHESGETLTGALPIAGTAQQLGSAITYARRYLLGSMTGVVTDSDDDARLATAAAKESARETRRQQAEESIPRITDTQSKRMHALLNEAGMGERPKKMELIEWYIRTKSDQRAIESSSELTSREASGIIDVLAERVAKVQAEAKAAPTEGGEGS